jgi:hypothetical protein
MGTLTTCSIWQKILLPNDDDIMALIMIQQSTKLIFFRGLALFYCYVEHTSSKKKHIKNELTAWFHDTGHWRNWIAFYSLHSSSCMLCKKRTGKNSFQVRRWKRENIFCENKPHPHELRSHSLHGILWNVRCVLDKLMGEGQSNMDFNFKLLKKV